ncbi:HTR-like protein [Halobacteriales archaeon SW_6_65_46]|nr:MAG: HTR-like protein [Halobacteriales archaeon SW_6_65_46]
MPAEQLESFLDNPAMREAVSIVFEQSSGGSEELQWGDVEDALSSGQWGRLIETGVLVSGGTGFAFANPERVEEILKQHGHLSDATDDVDEIESESWAWYDKAAGVATLALFTGYWNTGIRDLIASVDNIVLAPITDMFPFYAVIILLAVVTGFYSTVLQGRLIDREKLQAYQERMNELKERKEAAKERGDDEALEQVQEEQMEAAGGSLGMFKLQFRPTVWIMLITIPVFLWLRWKVRGGHLGVGETGIVVPLTGAVSWQEPLLGPVSTWIVWYFLCSMASRQIIQKTLNIQTSSASSS